MVSFNGSLWGNVVNGATWERRRVTEWHVVKGRVHNKPAGLRWKQLVNDRLLLAHPLSLFGKRPLSHDNNHTSSESNVNILLYLTLLWSLWLRAAFTDSVLCACSGEYYWLYATVLWSSPAFCICKHNSSQLLFSCSWQLRSCWLLSLTCIFLKM